MSQSRFDVSIARTARNHDELAWARQQRRKRRTAPRIALPDGPCCARCRHWRAPVDDALYGSCRKLRALVSGRHNGAVAGQRLPGEAPDPRIAEEITRGLDGESEPLRTKPHFACSRFTDQTTPLTTETAP